MNRQQRKIQEKYLKAIERGIRWEWCTDPGDSRYMLITLRIANGGMPTNEYAGREARDRLDRFCRGYLEGRESARRGEPPLRELDDAAIQVQLARMEAARHPLRTTELDSGSFWAQRVDPKDDRFALIVMRLPNTVCAQAAQQLVGLAARDALNRFCEGQLAADNQPTS